MKYLMSFVLMLFSFYSISQTVKIKNIGESYVSYESYFEDGSLKEKGLFCDNNKCGEWTSYHTNGSINTIASFSNGLKDGIWRFYDKDGILIYEVLYKSNVRVRVSEHTYFTAQVE
jgi:antitoxin component YwqK of YwqJK toxin-antitoxin module